jgi:hypothetical protein
MVQKGARKNKMFIFGNMKVASLSFEAEVNKGMISNFMHNFSIDDRAKS